MNIQPAAFNFVSQFPVEGLSLSLPQENLQYREAQNKQSYESIKANKGNKA